MPDLSVGTAAKLLAFVQAGKELPRPGCRGRHLKGDLKMLPSLVNPTDGDQGSREIDFRRRKSRPEAQGFAELSGGRRGVAGSQLGRAKTVMSIRLIGGQANRCSKGDGRLPRLTVFEQDITELHVRIGR